MPLVARMLGIIVIAEAMGCPLGAVELETGQKGTGLEIANRVYDFARVPRPKLLRAERKATEFFRKSGIETTWADCPLSEAELGQYPRCEALSGPAVISMKILPQSMAQHCGRFSNSPGFALLSGRGRFTTDAFILFPHISESADKMGCSLRTVLALAMAHEIGHLLLGQSGHSSRGIMKAKWGLTDARQVEMGRLRFNDSQTRAIRSQVRRRMAVSGLAPNREREPYSTLPVH